MNDFIAVNLAFEDELSGTVLEKILLCSGRNYQIGDRFLGHGAGFLKRRIRGFNQAARGMPYIVLTDLDAQECAPLKVREWLSIPCHANLIFRVAVREVESWLLADGQDLHQFLGISESLIPARPDEVLDPKQLLVNLARTSEKRGICESLVPRAGSTARVGPAYNRLLCRFVRDQWDPLIARKRSPSLNRAINAVERFQPVWRN